MTALDGRVETRVAEDLLGVAHAGAVEARRLLTVRSGIGTTRSL